MELSELTIYTNRLLSFDDRTGTVFEILSSDDGTKSYVVPRFVITEGDGDTDKGMKWEWATIKNNELIMGSMGKEFTNAAGEIENINNLWIAVLNQRGELRREDWQDKFAFVRELVGAAPPGCK
jgi:soluble calcium-activated nucleotidase 1